MKRQSLDSKICPSGAAEVVREVWFSGRTEEHQRTQSAAAAEEAEEVVAHLKETVVAVPTGVEAAAEGEEEGEVHHHLVSQRS